MIYKNMKSTNDILNQIAHDRKHSTSTQKVYQRAVRLFEKQTHLKLPEMLNIAETEEDNNLSWKNRSLRRWLIEYRNMVYDKYKMCTAKLYQTAIIAVFRHYEITVEKLPYFSTARANHSKEINPDLMPDREMLKIIINVKNPLLKAVVLFMSSSGLAKTDTLNLTVKDYLDATSEYHKSDNPIDAILEMKDKSVVGVWENLKRQKTGQTYYTFSSPESSTAINHYLLSRERLSPELPLFDRTGKTLSDLFQDTNDRLGLGKNGEFRRFATHMLRRYHATQLIEAGMSEGKVDMLQGRKPRSVAYSSYVKIKPSMLREEYIQCLPYLVVEDVEKYKTRLEVITEEKEVLEKENVEFKENYNKLWDEINNIKSRQDAWNEIKK